MNLVEIACDESGYEGEKLVGGVTDVFAHAAIALDRAAAAACVAELRERIRSPATEYKANHVLRSKHRPVLLWLLGSSGPLLGQAQVQLIDKAYFLVTQLTGQLIGEPAGDLYLAGRGTGGWEEFLEAGNDFLRSRDDVERFYSALDRLEYEDPTVKALEKSRPQAEALVQQDPPVIPPLDPLMRAIARAVEHWAEGSRWVAIAHDRQTTLSPERIAQLQAGTALARLELVHSFTDPRIQVADFLAGVARKIASDQLKGEDDVELTALIRPYVDPRSVWSDPASRQRLVW
ncbi:hypothetical protein [Kribbella sp. CA-293567]|uniref:hypothetical protein n=1 Tax=Kribbella sp. CA-293567 TaxID=3002436 RepID=UPI0022DD5AA5|nr:hypothetical protein [Kribbella sp. CA-293567]WBQ06731.1 hypothetical protein OX958_08035 [Kribbella sp. CA-293567]